jgi:hypothetical protein
MDQPSNGRIERSIHLLTQMVADSIALLEPLLLPGTSLTQTEQ